MKRHPYMTLPCRLLDGSQTKVTLLQHLTAGGHAEIWWARLGEIDVVARFLLFQDGDPMSQEERRRRFWAGWTAMVEHAEDALFVNALASNRDLPGGPEIDAMMVMERLPQEGRAREVAIALFLACDEAGLVTLLTELYSQLSRLHTLTQRAHGDSSLSNVLRGVRGGESVWLFIDLDAAHSAAEPGTDIGAAGRPGYWLPPALAARVSMPDATIEERFAFDVVCLATGLIAAIDGKAGEPAGNPNRREQRFATMPRLLRFLRAAQALAYRTASAALQGIATLDLPEAEAAAAGPMSDNSDGSTDVGVSSPESTAEVATDTATDNVSGSPPPPPAGESPDFSTEVVPPAAAPPPAVRARQRIPVQPERAPLPGGPSIPVERGHQPAPLGDWPKSAARRNNWRAPHVPLLFGLATALLLGVTGHVTTAARCEEVVRELHGEGPTRVDVAALTSVAGVEPSHQQAAADALGRTRSAPWLDPFGDWTRLADAQLAQFACVTHSDPAACESAAGELESLFDAGGGIAYYAGRSYIFIDRHAESCTDHSDLVSDPAQVSRAVALWEAGAEGEDLICARREHAALQADSIGTATQTLKSAYTELANLDAAPQRRTELGRDLADDAGTLQCGGGLPTERPRNPRRPGFDIQYTRACGFLVLGDKRLAEEALAGAQVPTDPPYERGRCATLPGAKAVAEAIKADLHAGGKPLAELMAACVGQFTRAGGP